MKGGLVLAGIIYGEREGGCWLGSKPMVLILDGNPEIGVHVRSNLCYFICLRHLLRSRAVTNRIISL